MDECTEIKGKAKDEINQKLTRHPFDVGCLALIDAILYFLTSQCISTSIMRNNL